FGVTGTADVTVVVGSGSPINQPPVVNAGNDQTITLPQNSLTLTGTATDPDGTVASRQWTRISGPTTGTIVSPNNLTTVVNGLVQGVYAFRLAATDNQGAVASDTVTVTVLPRPNQAPIVTLGSDFQVTLPATSAPLEGSVSDPDGIVVSTQWTMHGGMPGVIAEPNALNTIVTELEPGLYTFVLSATDNHGA